MQYITLFAKKVLKILALALSGTAFLISCVGASVESKPTIEAPGLYSQVLSPLNSLSVMDMSELKELDTNTVVGSVGIARYFPEKNTLLAVYIGDGFLRAWDIGDAKVVSEQNFGIISNVGLDFNESGDLVIGAMLHKITENDFGELAEYIGGVAVWDIDAGDLIKCVVHPCDKFSSSWQRDAISGVALDSQGQWVIENREIWISVSDITGSETPYSFSESENEDPRYAGLIAIDSNTGRYGIAFREGEVVIGDIGKRGPTQAFSKIFLGTYEKGTRHEITALNFSPDGKLLARIQDDNLTVWKIDTLSGDLYFAHNIPHSHLIAFNQSSDLLFIGTNDLISIWNIKEMEFIGDYATPNITSLSVSSDNRLLIWGDQKGVVHILGVLGKE
jgi:WD40 repeat protein